MIGTACTLRPEKALDVLIRAAAALLDDFADLRVLIAGEGPDRERVEALIAELGLGEVVSLLGGPWRHPRLPAGARRRGLLLGLGGKPALGDGVHGGRAAGGRDPGGGDPRHDRDGVEGVLVEPGDPEAIAGAVAELLRDPDEAAEMGRRGQRRRREEFDLDVTARMIGELYEELYAASGGAEALRLLFYADYAYHVEDSEGSAPRRRSRSSSPALGSVSSGCADRQESPSA